MRTNKIFHYAIATNLILGNLLLSRGFGSHEKVMPALLTYFVHSCIAIVFLFILFNVAKNDNNFHKSTYLAFLSSYLIPFISIDLILIIGCFIENDFSKLLFMLFSTFIASILFVWVFWIPFGFMNAFFVVSFIKSKKGKLT